jgi:hypothetical protein
VGRGTVGGGEVREMWGRMGSWRGRSEGAESEGEGWRGGGWCGGAGAGLLSNFVHLSGPSRAIKLLYPPALPLPTVHKTTSAPIIYMALCIMFLMRATSITRESGRRLGPGVKSFLDGSMLFHRAKNSRFPGPNHLPIA